MVYCQETSSFIPCRLVQQIASSSQLHHQPIAVSLGLHHIVRPCLALRLALPLTKLPSSATTFECDGLNSITLDAQT